MPSQSLLQWQDQRAAALDELEAAHQAIGGAGPGRRYATQQVNHAYAMLVSAQFQGFCRDLHSECVAALIEAIPDPGLQSIIQAEFLMSREIDRGNPHPGAIGKDFNRFGLDFWREVEAIDARKSSRMERLNRLNVWRNAIAHQDFDPAKLGGPSGLRLAEVQDWRRACGGLAQSFDQVMANHLSTFLKNLPW